MITDPYEILGISPAAGDAEIRAAYIAAVRDCPPERDPSGFEAIRAAYEKIETLKKRLEYEMFDRTAPTPEDLFFRLRGSFVPRRPEERTIVRVLDKK
ncbi:MAG: heat shock protein DnaJ protein [Leptospirillum sp. Group IV 'UBA BS']|nr:MAG: heat shock protein DnaJ protein [Leptospirillum sp. Group IV 'UBA BS']